jgi:hypothetical protein
MARAQKKSVRVVQGTIKYQLSDAGRRDLLLSGGNGQREQLLSGPVDASVLPSFAIGDDGRVSYDLSENDIHKLDHDEIQLPPGCNVFSDDATTALYWDTVPTWEQLISVIREIDRVTAFEKALRRGVAEEFMANPLARADSIGNFVAKIGGYGFSAASDLSRDVFREAVKRRDADLAALKLRNHATMTKWIERNGNSNQRERLAAGVLPWKEVHDYIHSSLFFDFDYDAVRIPPYKRFGTREACVCPSGDYEPRCEPKFQASDATELTASEWEQLSIVKKFFDRIATEAGASVEYQYREHSAKCVTAPEPVIRRGVIVKFTLDQLTFKNEFALTGVTHDSDRV